MVNKLKGGLILILTLILLSSFGFATDFTFDSKGMWTLQSSSLLGVIDQSPFNNDFTNYGTTYNAVSDSFTFDGTNDYLYQNSLSPLNTVGRSASFWIKPDVNSNTQDIFMISATGTGSPDVSMGIQISGGDATNFNMNFFYHDTVSSYHSAGNLRGLNVSVWTHVVATFNQSGTNYLYLNGTEFHSFASGGNFRTDGDTFDVGQRGDGIRWFDGQMSGITLFNYTLTPSQITELHAEGRGFNPYSTVIVNDSEFYIPQVTEANQIGTATITSTSYTPLFTGTVDVSLPTNLTATLTGSVYGDGGSAVANCEIEFNGTQLGFASASVPNNNYRSLYVNSEVVEVLAGTYNLTVSCKKDDISSFDATNFKLLLNQYSRDDGEPLLITYLESVFNASSTDYVVEDTLYFTTTNLTLDNGTTRYIVFEASLHEEYDSTATICIKGGALGVNTSDYCRYGASGSFGSGSAFTMIQEAPSNLTIPLQIYAKSTSGDGQINLTMNAFEIIAHTNEINLTELNSLPINSTDWQSVASHHFSNDDHVSISTVAKGSFSVQSNSGASDMAFRLRLNSATNETGEVIFRDVSTANQEGIVTIQEEFSGIGIGNYTLHLEARASNSDATITGGQMISYTANTVIFDSDTFNITAIDKWTDAIITNFSVVLNNAITLSDNGTGLIIAPVISDSIDIKIVRDNHPTRSYDSYNPVSNLEAVLGFNYVNFYDAREGSPLVNGSVQVEVSNGTVHDLTTNESGTIAFEDYDETYEITFLGYTGFLTPITFDLSESDLPFNQSYDISRATLNITLKDADTGALISDNVTVSVSGLGTYSTTTGNVTVVNLTIVSGVYTVYVDSEDYEYNQKTFTFTNQETLDVTIYMYPSNATNLGTYFVTGYDTFLDVSPEADLRLQVYDSDTQSFTEVAQRITNAQGVASFQVLLNEKIYRVYGRYTYEGIVYEGYTTELGRLITFDGDSENIYFDTITEIDYDEYGALSISVSNKDLIGNTSFHSVDFIDANGLDHEICLSYSYKDGVITKTSLEICTEDSSGTINQDGGKVLDRAYTWTVDVYIKEGNYKRYVYSEKYEKSGGFSDVFAFILKVLIGVLFLGGLAIALYLERADIFIYTSVFLSIVWLGLAPSYISARYLGLVIVLGFMVLDLAKNKNNTEED